MSAADDRAAGAAVSLRYLPWHAAARARIAGALAGGRLPHALLLHGPDGVGKERFATVVATGILCRRPGPEVLPCGECAECTLSRAGSHPDLHWLRRPEDRKTIGVDAVREVCEQLAMTSLRGGYRIAVVVQAQLMTPSAQNAFLKTLEEPAARTLLVLLSPRPSGVLATLRSRCQRVEISRPPGQAALDWLEGECGAAVQPGLLELAGGAPLKALELAPHYADLQSQMTAAISDLLADRVEITRVAADMLGDGLGARLAWIESWLGGSLRARLARDATHVGIPTPPQLHRAVADVNIDAAFRFVDRLRESRRLLEGSAVAQLVVEALLIDLLDTFRRKGVA